MTRRYAVSPGAELKVLMRLSSAIAIAWLCLSANIALALEPLDGKTREFLESHCFRCHGSKTQKAKFRLDNLSTDFSDPQVAQKWTPLPISASSPGISRRRYCEPVATTTVRPS